MRQLYVFTAGNADARKHLDDSIRASQPSTLLHEHLSEDQTAYLKSLLPDPDHFFAWGAVPGLRNRPMWDQMQDGDVVMTVFDNRYRYVSSVIAKVRNANLARAIWGQTTDEPEGKTWEYMYILTEPQAVNVHVTSEPVIGFLNNGYHGFSKISNERLARIRSAYGSLSEFVRVVFTTAIHPFAYEQDLEGAETKADETLFDADNLIDARQKILTEVVRRRGQPKFRQELLLAYKGRCAVTDCGVEAVLEAAHIIGYLDGNTNHISNGLLLRADVHTLFDLGLLRIDPQGCIHIDDTLYGSLYQQYAGENIRMPDLQKSRPHPDALARKFSQLI